jgi:lysophospholipase L1-like esterase
MPWLAAALLVLAFVGVELACRRWIRRHSGYRVWAPGLRLEWRQDPRLFPQVEPRVRFEVNADGERGGAVPADRAGLLRVLVAGGSSAECLALDQPTSWAGTLERLLGSAERLRALGARRVHVGSIARSGIGSRQLDLILERVLPQYGHLDAIVIMVGASDILRWLEEGAPPALSAAPDPDDVFSNHPGQRFGWSAGKSAAREVIRRLRRAWLHPVEVRENAGSWLVEARRMRAEASEMRHAVPDASVVLAGFDQHFRRLVVRAQQHARRVLIVRQPWFDREADPEEEARFWHGGVGRAWKQKITIFYSHDVLRQLMTLLDDRAAAIGDELGVPHLDLRPILAPSLDHYYDTFHYTPRGAGVVAEAVAAALVAADRRAPRTATGGYHALDPLVLGAS